MGNELGTLKKYKKEEVVDLWYVAYLVLTDRICTVP